MDRPFSRSVHTKTGERTFCGGNVRFGRQVADAAPYVSKRAYCHPRELTAAPKVDLCSTSINGSKTGGDSSFNLHGNICQSIDGQAFTKSTADVISSVVKKRHSSPSVIARLMGLDELRRHVVSGLQNDTGQFLLKKSSAGLQENSECFGSHEFHLSRRHQNLTIIHDRHDSSIVKYIDHVAQKEKYSKPDLPFIKRQVMGAENLFSNETLQYSKESIDALDISDSNKDIFLQFLQEPSSLPDKNFHYLKHSKSFSHTQSINNLRSPLDNSRENREHLIIAERTVNNYSAGEVKGRAWKRKDTSRGCANASARFDKCFAYNSTDSLLFKLLRSKCADKWETSSHSTSVILKPSFQKMQYRERTESCSLPFQNHKPSRGHMNVHQQLLGKKEEQHPFFQAKMKGCKRKATVEIARDISEQTSLSLRRRSEVLLASRPDINKSSTHSSEQCQSREAINELPEPWKIAEPYRQKLIGEASFTLGEMVSLSDQGLQTVDQLNLKNLSEEMVGKEDLRYSGAYTSTISSSYGWHVERDVYFPSAEGHPNSSVIYESSKSENRHQVGCFDYLDGCTTLKDTLNREKNNWNNLIIDRGRSLPRNFKNHDNNPTVIRSNGEENKRPVKVVKVCHDASRSRTNLNNLIEPRPIYLPRNMNEFLHLDYSCSNPENYPDKSLFYNMKEFHQSAKYKDLSVIVLENMIPEVASVDFPPLESPLYGLTQSGACIAPKVTERLSPVSVLDPQSHAGKTTPECLERIGAVLHDLQRQHSCHEIENVDSGDDLSNPVLFYDEVDKEMMKSLKHEAGRDFLYLLDILTVSGINASSQKRFFDSCYLSDNPIFPDVFDKLEKKYSMVNLWSRSERKLLFDHINTVLAEVLAPYLDLHPWVKLRSRASCGLDKLVNESWRMLVRQQRELSKGKPEDKVLDTRWLYLDDHVDMVGRELEKMLKDDLLDELVSEFILG